MSSSATHLRKSALLASLALLVGGLSACSSDGAGNGSSDAAQGANGDASNVAAQSVKVSANVGPKDVVPVDRLVTVNADGGTITKVVLRSAEGAKVPGKLNADSTGWTATDRLEPGTTYVVRTTTKNDSGTLKRTRSQFSTQDLSLDQQTYASVAPLEGETVGVGMPVVVHFDLPVTEKKAFEKHMTVTSTPSQKGTWHWISDTEAHFRPASYWQAGTDVSVDVDVNALPAGNGIYGQESRTVNFHIGDSVISKVNAQTHQMKTFINGKLVKTMPITLGKDGFTTRSGVKVIMEKYRTKRMNSETVGIPADSAEAYDIDNVEYAMRVTSSGEFVHAAPWSTGSQGYANVSHGCTGLSTANAAWLYSVSKRGDVVEYTGTGRPMTLTNGYGDWNESFSTYRQGSAL